MAEVAVGIMSQKVNFPARAERVARATEYFMRVRGLSVGEVAFAAQVDKRDLQRLLRDRSCGSRLEDDLAAYFGWDFTEMVMTPIHGADPTSAREAEIARHLQQAAALSARVARDRAARDGASAALGPAPLADVVSLAGAKASAGPRARREHRAFAEPPTAPA